MDDLPPILESSSFPGRKAGSPEAIRQWEAKHACTLPKWLTSLLLILNGGMLKGADYEIMPLEEFRWVEEDLDDAPSGEMRLLFIGWHCSIASRLVLDYTHPGEPEIRLLFMDVGGDFDVVDENFLRADGIDGGNEPQ